MKRMEVCNYTLSRNTRKKLRCRETHAKKRASNHMLSLYAVEKHTQKTEHMKICHDASNYMLSNNTAVLGKGEGVEQTECNVRWNRWDGAH